MAGSRARQFWRSSLPPSFAHTPAPCHHHHHHHHHPTQATSRVQLAALSRTDYSGVVAAAARESFEGLRLMAALLENRWGVAGG